MKSVERGPVLIVGRVGSVRREFRVPDGSMPWHAEIWAMTAHMTVLRSYSLSERNAPTSGSSIDVRFFAYGSSQTLFINGSPPPLVHVQSGEVLIFPLLSNEEPRSKPWMLLGIDGLSLTIRVRAELFENAPNADSGRKFILRELANSLSRRTPEESSSAGGYVHDQYENLTPELMPLLERHIGVDKRRWAAVVVDLMGTSRPTIEELRAGGWRDINWNPSADHGYSIAAAILKTKLPDSPISDRLIIDALMVRVSLAPDYASLLADEYASNEYLSSLLNAALTRHRPGALYVAWTLVNKGHGSFRPHAVKAARELAGTGAKANLTYAQERDRNAADSLIR